MTDSLIQRIIKEQQLQRLTIEQVQAAVTDVLEANEQAVVDYKAGKKKVFKFLVGKVMKKTRGCADPGDVHKVLVEQLEDEGIKK